MNNNAFVKGATISAQTTLTENGHAAASTTGSAVLDLYGQIGALRGQDFDDRVLPLLKAAINDDKLLATKTMFYGRDARGGTGERETFRKMLNWCAFTHPEMVLPNLELIPFYGRWDDLYVLADTPLEAEMFHLITKQLYRDISAHNRKEPVSLLAKWLKSCNASSSESRRLGKMTADALGLTEREYRLCLTALRRDIKIVETQMSSGKWSEIEYEKVPSRAGVIYRKAFCRHDEDRYAEYIASVNRGEKKINAAMNTPQDLVHAYFGNYNTPFGMISEDPTIEAMWKNLPDYVDSEENVLVMADTSGSMCGRPMEISVGLALYFAQHNRGEFHNLFMTFSGNPQFVVLKDESSFLDNIRLAYDTDWGYNTDLDAACKLILWTAKKNNVPQKDMPRRLIVISDMEIDRATDGEDLHCEELKKMYEDAGYSMPQIIYWNADARHNHFQTRCDISGTMLASGSSPAVFEAVMAMEDLDATPLDAMLEVLNGERYAKIRVDEELKL